MTNTPNRQFGNYELGDEIGKGWMASVYRAYQRSFNRYVAIKVIAPSLSRDPLFMARFEREAQIIAGLQHPHIVPVYDFGRQDETTYLVMRLIEGGSLEQYAAEVFPAT